MFIQLDSEDVTSEFLIFDVKLLVENLKFLTTYCITDVAITAAYVLKEKNAILTL